MDAHRQGLDQGSFLKCHVIWQPEEEVNISYDHFQSLAKIQQCLWPAWGLWHDPIEGILVSWQSLRLKHLLVTEVGAVLVVPAKVAIIGGCGAEEYRRRKIVPS